MRLRRQFEGGLFALLLSAGLTSSCLANQQHNNPHPRQESRPAPRGNNSARKEQRQQQGRNQESQNRSERPYAGSTNADRQGPAANRQGADPNRPPANQYSRGAQSNNGYRNNQISRLSPEDRRRVLQNQQRFRQLSPQQQQEMRDRSRVWEQMTPQQRDHIKNEVLPAWRNLPPQRQKAISQRLGVLQNMPESARNQHLNDPNFTRGMNDEDRATLRDLSHLHVGGAPDAPHE
jgi:hypothetical protein